MPAWAWPTPTATPGTDGEPETPGWPAQDSGYLPGRQDHPNARPGIRGHPRRRTQTAPLCSDDAAQCVNMRTDSTLSPAQSRGSGQPHPPALWRPDRTGRFHRDVPEHGRLPTAARWMIRGWRPSPAQDSDRGHRRHPDRPGQCSMHCGRRSQCHGNREDPVGGRTGRSQSRGLMYKYAARATAHGTDRQGCWSPDNNTKVPC